MSYQLYAVENSGSAIVEAMFALAGIDYEAIYLVYGEGGVENPALKTLNPLNQIPTLRLPNGSVITESAAIALHVADIAPKAGLVPDASASERPAFLRWLVFIAAAIYPTFTYGDFPGRWVTGKAAEEELVRKNDEHRQKLWRYLEDQISSGPWFMEGGFSVLDIYLSVMSHWRPGRNWFKDNCPKIYQIAREVDKMPLLADIWLRNFKGNS